MKSMILGAGGMVGSALARRMPSAIAITRMDADLRDPSQVMAIIHKHKPDAIYLAAAKVGGILANEMKPVDFLYDNLMIQNNVMHSAAKVGVPKLLFLGSSCIYPRACPQPMKEGHLMTGQLESTNKPYAMAKLAGMELAKAYSKQHGLHYFSVLPCNLYGQGDTYDAFNSHVIPALILKVLEAKASEEDFVEIWGTGNVRREFMHVDDLADACIFLMDYYNSVQPVNIGTGEEITISKLALMIAHICNYKGQFMYDTNKPDGVERKLLDSSKIHAMGWKHSIGLEKGLRQVISLQSNRNTKHGR